jgi:glucans biosynthesis protein C
MWIAPRELRGAHACTPGHARAECACGQPARRPTGDSMKQRLAYLDNLKILLVAGVIAVHTAITYGLDGSWYLESYDQMTGVAVDLVTVVLGIGWLFGLGLFFMIAGRLSGPSLDRKGPRRFARERLLRLGIPLVAYTLLISPLLEYVDYRWNAGGTRALWPFVAEQVWHFAPGPTWFLEALLAFTLGYALLRQVRPQTEPPARRSLRGRQVAAIALAIAVTSFATRFAFPVGSEQLHLQLAVFPQYVILFSLGVAGGRRGWLEALGPNLRRRCALAGAIASLALPAVLVAGGFFEGEAGEDSFAGGWHWQAAAGALIEGVLATCVSLYAVEYFRRRHNRLQPLARRMAPAAYGAFVVHPPVLVGLALAVQPLPLPAELKFVAVLTAGITGAFSLARLASRAGPIAGLIGSGPPERRSLPSARPSQPAVAAPAHARPSA